MKYITPKFIETDDRRWVPVDPKNSDYRDIIASGVAIEPYVAPTIEGTVSKDRIILDIMYATMALEAATDPRRIQELRALIAKDKAELAAIREI